MVQAAERSCKVCLGHPRIFLMRGSLSALLADSGHQCSVERKQIIFRQPAISVTQGRMSSLSSNSKLERVFLEGDLL